MANGKPLKLPNLESRPLCFMEFLFVNWLCLFKAWKYFWTTAAPNTFQIWIQKRNTVGCEIALWPKPLVFLDFYRVWLAPWPLKQAIGNSGKYFSRYFGWCSIPFDRELYFWNTSSAPPPLPPLQLQCVSECPIKAIWAWSLQCTRAKPDKTLCRPPSNNRLWSV